MRRASAALLTVVLACAVFGCAAPAAPVGADDGARARPVRADRGAELYGRYCTGCHAPSLRGTQVAANAPWLMHIQARVGMGTMPSGISETLMREDARLIVDYLGARHPSPLDD
jgi:mono/diheme cytochrome c family protein